MSEQKQTVENFISMIKMNNYQRPVVKEVIGKDYVLNGTNNSHFQTLIDRKLGSPTNSTIINKYSGFIYGKGLTTTDIDKSILALFPKKDVKKIVADYKHFGSATFQVIYSKGKGALRKVTGIYHIPRQTIAPNIMNDEGEIEGFWYCRDWSNTRKNEPEFFPAFGTSKDDIEIYEIKDYEAGSDYFAKADWESCLEWCETDEEISHYTLSHMQNGLSAGFVINLNNGIPELETRKKVEADIKRKVTGSNAAGNVVVSFNNSDATKTTVEAFPTNDNHKQWQYVSQECKTQIMVAHEVTNPILFGLEKSSGFGNNSEEINTATKFLYATVIVPYQETILDAFQDILKANGKQIELEFLPLIDFTKEDGTTTDTGENVEMSSKKKVESLDDFTAKALIDLGQDVSSVEGYEIIHEEEVTDNSFEANLATAISGQPTTKSEQDNLLFKVRYTYAPSEVSDNSRAFCQKMVTANKVYRKEDIIEAGNQVVNAGLGANGSDTYSIWKFKGGVNCKHFWQRRVYIKTNNSIISVNEARRKILELEPSQRDEVRLPQNEKEVAQAASESNNYWKLN